MYKISLWTFCTMCYIFAETLNNLHGLYAHSETHCNACCNPSRWLLTCPVYVPLSTTGPQQELQITGNSDKHRIRVRSPEAIIRIASSLGADRAKTGCKDRSARGIMRCPLTADNYHHPAEKNRLLERIRETSCGASVLWRQGGGHMRTERGGGTCLPVPSGGRVYLVQMSNFWLSEEQEYRQRDRQTDRWIGVV